MKSDVFCVELQLHFHWYLSSCLKTCVAMETVMKSTAEAISLSSRSGWSGKVENARPENQLFGLKSRHHRESRADRRFGGELREGTGGRFQG